MEIFSSSQTPLNDTPIPIEKGLDANQNITMLIIFVVINIVMIVIVTKLNIPEADERKRSSKEVKKNTKSNHLKIPILSQKK